jgi:hypothetical protein
MGQTIERRERRDQVENRIDPIGDAEGERLERLARLAVHFSQLVIAEYQVRELRELFIDEARGVDQRAIIRQVAVHIVKGSPRANIPAVVAECWDHAHRILGWRNLATLEVQGAA